MIKVRNAALPLFPGAGSNQGAPITRGSAQTRIFTENSIFCCQGWDRLVDDQLRVYLRPAGLTGKLIQAHPRRAAGYDDRNVPLRNRTAKVYVGAGIGRRRLCGVPVEMAMTVGPAEFAAKKAIWTRRKA